LNFPTVMRYKFAPEVVSHFAMELPLWILPGLLTRTIEERLQLSW